VISHGANTSRPGRSRFHDEFDWTGTNDPTPFLSIPAALTTVGGLVAGGWPEVRSRNRGLVLAARTSVAESLGLEPPCPDGMVGALVSLPLPPSRTAQEFGADPLQRGLLERHRIEVPVFQWPGASGRLLRISAQLYNSPDQYERLARVLSQELVNLVKNGNLTGGAA